MLREVHCEEQRKWLCPSDRMETKISLIKKYCAVKIWQLSRNASDKSIKINFHRQLHLFFSQHLIFFFVKFIGNGVRVFYEHLLLSGTSHHFGVKTNLHERVSLNRIVVSVLDHE